MKLNPPFTAHRRPPRVQRGRALVIVAAILGTAGAALAGYLPRIGPSPLRFQTLSADSPGAKAVLPPLNMGEKPVVEDETTDARSDTSGVETNSVPPARPALPPPETKKNISKASYPTNAPSEWMPPLAATSNASFTSADLLVQFFKPFGGGTNASGVLVTVPVNTTEVRLSLPPSSTATYTNR